MRLSVVCWMMLQFFEASVPSAWKTPPVGNIYPVQVGWLAGWGS